jgi:hypothetical protein
MNRRRWSAGRCRRCLPDWKAAGTAQPAATDNEYIDYRSERQRDVGRPVGMPLMSVRLDSSKHNYSSARFDAQVYRRGVSKVRGWLKLRVLDRLVNIIAREAQLYATANPRWEFAALRKRPGERQISLDVARVSARGR